MVNRSRTFSEPPIAQLIGRIADDDIEFHVKNLLWRICVNEGIGMAFQFAAPVVVLLVGSAIPATTIFPGVLNALEADIALRVVKYLTDGILSICYLAAVHGPTRNQRSQLRDGESEELILEDVV